MLQACDALDGVADGVVDNVPACIARFDPVTATYTDYTGALGPAETTYPLQCTGAKTRPVCRRRKSRPPEIINRGTADKHRRRWCWHRQRLPDPVTFVAFGYQYDGGWMTTTGIPARKIGTSSPTSLPGDYSLGVGTFGYAYLTPPCPTCTALNFNFDTSTLTQGGNVYVFGYQEPL